MLFLVSVWCQFGVSLVSVRFQLFAHLTCSTLQKWLKNRRPEGELMSVLVSVWIVLLSNFLHLNAK